MLHGVVLEADTTAPEEYAVPDTQRALLRGLCQTEGQALAVLGYRLVQRACLFSRPLHCQTIFATFISTF